MNVRPTGRTFCTKLRKAAVWTERSFFSSSNQCVFMVRANLSAIRCLRAPVMRLTAIKTQTERKGQDNSVRQAEKHACGARMMRAQGPIRPAPALCATADTAWGDENLLSGRIQDILRSSGRRLGECRLSTTPRNGLTYPAAGSDRGVLQECFPSTSRLSSIFR